MKCSRSNRCVQDQKGSGKFFCTPGLPYAQRADLSTRTVADHALKNHFSKQIVLQIAVPLRLPYQHATHFEVILRGFVENENAVCMRQYLLVELDHPGMCHNFSKYPSLDDEFHKCRDVQVENPCAKICPILWRLFW